MPKCTHSSGSILVTGAVFLSLLLGAWLASYAAAGWELRRAKAALLAAGAPLTLEELASEQLPAESNAAPLLEEVGRLMKKLKQREGYVAYQPGRGNAETDPLLFDEVGWARLREQMEWPEIQQVLHLLRQASTMDGARFERDYSKWMFMELGPLSGQLSASRLLETAAWLKAKHGDASGAAADLEACSRLAAFGLADVLLITWLVGISQDLACIDTAALAISVLPHNGFRSDSWKRLGDLWDSRTERARGSLIRALDGERIGASLWTFETLLRGEQSAAYLIDAILSRDTPIASDGRFSLWLYQYPVRQLLMADYAAFLHFSLALRSLVASSAVGGANGDNLLDEIPRLALLTRLSAAALAGAVERLDEYLVKLQLGRIGLQLEDYRATHGAYPVSLDQLGLPPTSLADPFSGKPFVYRTEGSGVLLYSVGPDRSDHGGEARRSGKNRDLVWRVERPAQ